MANILPVIDQITLEAIAGLYEDSVLIPNTYKNYGPEFDPAKSTGNSVRGRKPNRPVVGHDVDITALIAAGGGDINQNYFTITTGRSDTAITLPSNDETFKIDKSKAAYIDGVLKPAYQALARDTDVRGFQTMLLGSMNRVKRDTMTNAVTFTDVLQMKARLGKQLVKNDLMLALGELDNVDLVNDNKALYNSQGQVSKQNETGVMALAGGFDFKLTESVGYLTTGTCTDFGDVASALSEGIQAIPVENALVSATPGGTVKAGQAFTIAGIYQIDPQRHERINQLATLVCAEDVTLTSGSGTIKITAPLYTTNTNSTYANVYVGTAATSAALSTVSSGTVTQLEPAASIGQIMYGWSPLLVAYASIKLPMPKAGVITTSKRVNDIDLRIMEFHNGMVDSGTSRMDLQDGYAVTYPEALCTMIGKMTAL